MDRIPVTAAQRPLWLFQQANPESSAYHITGTFEVPAELELDQNRAVRILEVLTSRHTALRTVFSEAHGEPVRLVKEQGRADVRELVIEDDQELRCIEKCAVRKPFDLSSGPLMRVILVRSRLSCRLHLVWVVHHIVCDGISLGYLAREFLFLARPGVPLLPAAAEPQGSLLQHCPGKSAVPAAAYWRSVLRLPPVRLPLPFRPSSQTDERSACAAYATTIPAVTVKALMHVCKAHEVTPFAVLLATFFVLLYKITRENDLIVAVPVAVRPRADARGVVGLFVNTNPVRVQVESNMTFSQLLLKVRDHLKASQPYQDYPFSSMLTDAGIASPPGEFPLTPVLFNLLPRSPAAAALLPARDGHVDVHTDAKIDLECYLFKRSDTYSIELHYRRSLFRPETMEGLGSGFNALLESAVNQTSREIAALPLLAREDWRREQSPWNDTGVAYQRERQVHQLFQRQAEATPAAIALSAAGTHISYGELNASVVRLASKLRQRGVRAEILVGVCIDRCPELVVALLAVLKAGGAFLPLDPCAPTDRLALLVADAQPLLVLTKRSCRETVSHFCEVLCIDDLADDLGHFYEVPEELCNPRSLAYVIYTSGSTGRPKGVLKEHAGLTNYLQFLVRKSGMSAGDVVLQVTNITFDPAMREVFGPLIAGARTALISSEEASDPQAILRHIEHSGATMLLGITPSLLREVCACARRPPLHRLRRIFTSGEVLSSADVAAIRNCFGSGVAIVNQYGPTEITMVATCADIEGDGEPTIGRPVSNVRVHILDVGLQPVPVGLPGEICLSGVGLARGYLHNPKLTKERFVANAVIGEDRMYRTGDLGQYCSDGNIQYIGRIDDQVKLSGVRVELGEIEATIVQLQAVQRAAVVAVERRGVKILVAYVVMHGESADAHALRHALRSRLPEYMIPTQFVPVSHLPLNRNGKIDRAKLPEPESYRRPRGPGKRPATVTEAALVEIWEEVLAMGGVGIDDEFFDLGGTSLQAMRVLTRLNEKFNLQVSVRALFAHTTVSRLAEYVDELCARHALESVLSAPQGSTRTLDF